MAVFSHALASPVTPVEAQNTDDSVRSRRKRLLGEIFRNAMALAMLKQVLVAGQVGVEHGDDKSNGGAVPGHLEG